MSQFRQRFEELTGRLWAAKVQVSNLERSLRGLRKECPHSTTATVTQEELYTLSPFPKTSTTRCVDCEKILKEVCE